MLMCACSNTEIDDSNQQKVISATSNIHINRNYVYYSFYQTNSLRCNLDTMDLSYACMEIGCDHRSNCPLYDCDIAFVAKDRLYLRGTYYSKNSNAQYYGYYDLNDGAKKILRDCSEEESYGGYPVTDGEYIYYTYKKLKENGNKDNAEDYLPAVCRMPLDGGEEEFLAYTEDDSAILTFVANGRLIFVATDNVIYSTALDGSNKIIILDDEKYVGVSGTFHLYDGYIYLLANDGSRETLLDGRTTAKRKLLRVNIATGIYEVLVSNYVALFTMNETGIYYYPFKVNYLHIPQNLEKSNCIVYTADYDLWSCDLDGGNSHKLFDYENLMQTSSSFGVANGYIYGLFRSFDKNTLSKTSPIFSRINLSTGKVEEIANIGEYFNIVS